MSIHVQVLDGVAEQVEARLPDVRGLNVLPISALKGAGTPQLLPAAVTLYEAWTRRIPTARLNRWLVAVSRPAVADVAQSHTDPEVHRAARSWLGAASC